MKTIDPKTPLYELPDSEFMKTQHTPGPWESVEQGGIRYVKKPGYRYIARCNNPAICEQEQQANARLIAAAPEILKALQHIASLSDLKNAPMQSDAWHAWLIATHAVVEATGEAQ